MPQITFKDLITRDMLRSNPNWLFVFGDNMSRIGRGGQAKQMRGEPNAVGIPTKWEPASIPEAYFKDSDLEGSVKIAIDDAFAKLKAHRDMIVIPTAGVGTGYAQLALRAPRIAAYIDSKFQELFNA